MFKKLVSAVLGIWLVKKYVVPRLNGRKNEVDEADQGL